MTTVKLTDEFGLNADVKPEPTGALLKYFKSLPGILIRGAPIGPISGLDLDSPGITTLQTGLSFEKPVDVGTDAVELSLKPEISGALRVFVPSEDSASLFQPDEYGDNISVDLEHRYVSAGLTFSVGTSLRGKAGALGFGCDAESLLTITNYRLFETKPTPPSLLSAVLATLSSYRIPGDLDDLKALYPGQVIAVNGRGSLEFSGTANLVGIVNPLATAELPSHIPALSLISGATIQIGSTFQLSCEYQIRIHKLDQNRLRLGYYRKHGSAFSVRASVSAGLAAGTSDTDFLPKILSAISKNAEADLAELQAAGPSPSHISDTHKALEAGVQRRLELAASFEFGSLQSDQPAFLYEADLAALDEAGQAAICKSLKGNLSSLTQAEENLPRGITLVRSIFTKIRESKHVLKINLLGIYNSISVSKLVLTGKVLYEPESGELTFTDAVAAERVRAAGVNFGADARKLRKALAESFLITAAYRGSKFIAASPELTAIHSYFELHAKTDQNTIRRDLNVAVALGLMTINEEESLIEGINDFYRTAVYAATSYDDDLTVALFLDGDTPRLSESYETAGREALQMLVREGDADEYRRLPAINDDLWQKMKQAGQFNFEALFPGLSNLQVKVIAADYTTIMWWAKAMTGTGKKLQQIRHFFAANPNPGPDHSVLRSLRNEFAGHLKSVAATTREEFGEPWGLVAMFQLSNRQGKAHVQYTGPRVALERGQV